MTAQADVVKQSVSKLENLAATIQQVLAVTKNRIKQSFYAMGTAAAVLFMSAIIAAGIVHYYGNKIADKRAELLLVETKMRGKPEVTRYTAAHN